MTNPLIPPADHPPYELPLSRDDFRAALRRGHGRAWRHAAVHGVDDRLDDVIHGCLHDLTYDPQCECERVGWMLSMLDAAGALEEAIPRIIEGSAQRAEGEKAYWHEAQRCSVLHCLAAQGLDGAREGLYAKFRREPDSMDMVGVVEIIDLDGADGLLFVCESLGRLVAGDPELRIDDAPLAIFDERHQDGAARRILENARGLNADVDRFLAQLDAHDAERRAVRDGDPTSPGRSAAAKEGYRDLGQLRLDPRPDGMRNWVNSRTGAEIVEWINTAESDRGFWLRGWGRRAERAELEPLLDALATEDDPLRLERLLRAFSWRPLSRAIERVIDFTEHAELGVRRSARIALSQVNDPRVRAHAIAMLRSVGPGDDVVGMLESSYRPGDFREIERALCLPDVDWELHWIIFELVDLLKRHALVELGGIARFVYAWSPCTNCRGSAVDWMIENECLPAWIADECPHDADEEIRESVEKK